jgi:transposase-like protein
MSKSTISTFQLFKLFPDQETARLYLESRLWPNGPQCPVCGLGERVTVRKGGYYRCNQCSEDFTVRTGTIFERSHIPLHKWIYAMYLLVTSRKGISSLQLSKEIGITQKSAWFMLHRLREACGPNMKKLRGIIEIDETYVGGLEGNKHEAKKLRAGRGPVGKTPVLAMRERGEGGRTLAMVTPVVDLPAVHTAIYEHIEIGSELHTDEAPVYDGIGGLFFEHATINHSRKQYVSYDITTNSAESFFAVFKRGLMGIYHQVSVKHLNRYVNEFAFRLNEGNCKRVTMDRINDFVSGAAFKRLTYEWLTT